jgi:hypothetical protein
LPVRSDLDGCTAHFSWALIRLPAMRYKNLVAIEETAVYCSKPGGQNGNPACLTILYYIANGIYLELPG